MRRSRAALVLIVGFLALSACAVPQTATPATPQPSPSQTPDPTSSPTPTLAATPSLTPTGGFAPPNPTSTPNPYEPAKLSAGFIGSLPEQAVARLGQGALQPPLLSPQEHYLAVTTSTGVLMYKTDTLTLMWADASGDVAHKAWTADERLFVAALEDPPSLVVWDAAAGKRLHTIRTGKARIRNLDITPDGRYLLTSAQNGVAIIWDVASGTALHYLIQHEKLPEKVANKPIGDMTGKLRPDGLVYLTYYQYQDEPGYNYPLPFMILWDVPSGQKIKVLVDEASVQNANWSRDSKQLTSDPWAPTSDDGNGQLGWASRIWNLDTGQHSEFPFSPDRGDWSPDGSMAVMAGAYGLNVYDRTTQKVLFHIDADTSKWRNNTAAWSADGRHLAYFDDGQKQIDIIDVATWKTTKQIHDITGDPVVSSTIFTHDLSSLYLLHGYNHTAVEVWDLQSGQLKKTLITGARGAVNNPAWSPDGKYLAVELRYWYTGYDQTLIWDVEQKQLVTIVDAPGAPIWSPDGKTLAVLCCKYITLVDTATWEPRGVIPNETPNYLWESGFTWSPDGRSFAYADTSGRVFIRDAASGDLRLELPIAPVDNEHRCSGLDLTGLAWSGDGKWIATSYGCPTQSMRLWDAQTGAVAKELPVGRGRPFYLGFSTDGTTLNAIAQNTEDTVGMQGGGGPVGNPWLSIWPLDGGEPRSVPIVLPGGPYSGPETWSPDGSMVAGPNTDGTIILYDARTGQIIKKLPGHTDAASVAFSPDGTKLASASDDGTVIIWDLSR